MAKSKKCSKCGETDQSKFTPSKSQCRACFQQGERNRRASRREARVDPSVHDYGKGLLPEGFHTRGISQMIGADGEIKLQWVKSAKDPDSERALEEYLEILRDTFAGIKGKFKPAKPLKRELDSELLDIVPIGDAHVGLMTWWEETGENFDLKIAREMYERAYSRLFANASGADTLVMANLGDYFHSDGGKNATSKGTPVDVDGRWQKVLRTGIEIMINAVRTALTKYERVVIYTMAGNHDKEAAVALRMCLHFAFENEPRVDVKDSPRKVQFLEHGRCLIGFSHGDMAKPDKLPMIMAADQKEAWGRTDHRHYYGGHVHHDQLKDYGQVTVETVRVLGPADAWHTEAGYRSKRDIKIDTWSKKHGRIDRSIIGISQLIEAA